MDSNNGDHMNSAQREDQFFEERMRHHPPEQDPFGQIPPPFHVPYMNPYDNIPKKRKLAAGLLAFFIPGTGHFYLGLMQKGLMVMMLFILNITAIVYTARSNMENNNSYIPFVVLLACLVPVIYFYNLFDALQSTDQVNGYRRAVQLGQLPPPAAGTDSLGKQARGGALGIGLIAIGLFLFLVSAKPAWMQELFDMLGSYVGAVLLIGAGLLLFLTESKKR